jgi:phospholipase/carboxylesterase
MSSSLRFLFAAVLAALAVSGCGPREPAVAALEPEVPVAFEVRLPEMYDPEEDYPLLICLPDAGQTETSVTDMWDQGLFYMPDFILVAVRGTFYYGGGQAWFKQDPSEDPLSVRRGAARTGDERVTEVLEEIENQYNVDPDWRFIGGFGDGAAMAFYAGFRHPDLFQGVAGFGAGIDSAIVSRQMLRGIRDMDVFATAPLDEELLSQAGARVKVHGLPAGATVPASALRAMQNFFSLAEEEAPEDEVPYLMPEPEPEFEDLPPPDSGE